jgi:uncharacterized DUF497 family protein
MQYVWDEGKNDILKKTRNISFEQVMLAIEEKNIVDVIDHPNQEKYKGQIFILVEIDNYVYVVPAYISPSGGEPRPLVSAEVPEEDCHLITIYPSRKYTNRYLGGQNG